MTDKHQQSCVAQELAFGEITIKFQSTESKGLEPSTRFTRPPSLCCIGQRGLIYYLPIWIGGCQDDRGAGVGVAGDPGAVDGK